jgi:CheY-like chemotaxis protein
MNQPRVLSVGQCGYDHGRIARHLRDAFGARAERADSAGEALAAARSGGLALLLVNRVLDGDGSSGLALIAALKADPATAGVPAMLVSNYADAQAQAVALGALPGFGKADLDRPRAAEALGAVLAPAGAST